MTEHESSRFHGLDDSTTKYLDANGLRFAYQYYFPSNHQSGRPSNRQSNRQSDRQSRDQSEGTSSRPAIVLIRGLGTQMIEWSPILIDQLTRGGLRVVIFDNRDVGLTSKLSADYPLSDMADDVVALMADLGESRFHVFGISLGGMVAQLVASRHPQAVMSLFSVMSASGNPGATASGDVRERLNVTAESRQDQIELEVENRLLWGSPGFSESEDQRRAMATRIYDRCHYPGGIARQMRAVMADGSRVERLADVQSPTLVIHGADDPLILPEFGEETARAIAGAEFQLVGGMGHNIPDALAADIASRVLTFLRDA